MKKNLIFALFSLFLSACFLDQNKDRGKIGEEMSAISAKNMQGQSVNLNDTKEKLKVLVFFQNGCSSCLKELSMLDKFAQENKEKIAVYAINSEDEKEIIEALTKGLENIQVLQDDLKITAKRYSIFATPTTVFIKDGIIKERILGEKPWEFIELKLNDLL